MDNISIRLSDRMLLRISTKLDWKPTLGIFFFNLCFSHMNLT